MTTALDIQHLHKAFGARQVVRDLSLSVPRGAIYGLLGPNGAGKTTLLKVVMGLLPPTSGAIRILGDHLPGSRGAQRATGYMPQAIALYPGLSARENIQFFGRLYGVGADLGARTDKLLELVELGDRADDPVGDFSGGMARRAMLASALIHEPALLILDEPTAGVDPSLRVRFWGWLRELASRGTAILITTHHIAEAKDAEQVIFLREGSLLEQGSPADVMARYGADDLEAAFVSATSATSATDAESGPNATAHGKETTP